MIIKHTILYKNSSIHVDSFGFGRQQVICFHGYGETASSFHFLEEFAMAEYHFFAVDLPFHGQTNWQEEESFTPADLLNIISLVKNLHLSSSKEKKELDDQIILIGFSLGGRVCLSALEKAPKHFKKIILLAPDGLKMNPWYWLATQNRAGNKLFAFTMKRPGWFLKLLRKMKRTNRINQSIYKFVHFYLDDEKVRRQLYQRWTGLRKIKPNISIIKKNIKEYKTPVQLIYGRYDRIILPVRGEKFCKGIEPFCKLKVLRSGHQVLDKTHVAEILQALH